MMSTGGGGCGCAVPGTSPVGSGAGWLALLGLGLVVRRRRRRSVALVALSVLALAGCGDDDGMMMDVGIDGTVPDSAVDGGTDTGGMDSAMMDAGMDTAMMDTGPDLRRILLDALGSSVWSATAERTEGLALVERAYEMRIEAASLEWAEIRNPFGPSRLRTLRSFTVNTDGLTVDSIILSPAGWPVHPRNGERQTWEFEVIDGDPRVLRITDTESGAIEEFAEGPWAAPTSGLTAEIRVFGPTGAAHSAFCGAGSFLEDSERRTLWSFARGESAIPVLGYDVVAGAQLQVWDDSSSGANDFAVTDIHGFDQLGATLLSDQFNFVVRYTGTIRHPGGNFRMRERDDDLEDVLWSFVGDQVGSSNPSDLFLEVHNWINADATDDEVSRSIAAGDVPVEIIAVRCAMPFDGKDMRAEMNIGTGWMLVGDQPSDPIIDDTLFPPAL